MEHPSAACNAFPVSAPFFPVVVKHLSLACQMHMYHVDGQYAAQPQSLLEQPSDARYASLLSGREVSAMVGNQICLSNLHASHSHVKFTGKANQLRTF